MHNMMLQCNIVTWRLKAGIVKTEKMAIARNGLLKHVSGMTSWNSQLLSSTR
jgi:hypothetical protein